MSLIDLDEAQDVKPRETEPLFRFKGVVYEIPKEFTPAESLRALEIASSSGFAASLVYLMKVALGDDAWKVLTSAEEMTPEQYQAISQVIQDKALASAKRMTGN